MDVGGLTRDILVSAIGAAVYGVASVFISLPRIGNSARVGLELLRNQIIQFLLLTVLLFFIMWATRRVFEWRRNRAKPKPGPPIASTRRRPTKIAWNGSVRKYGVVWPAAYGSFRGDPYPYTEGAHCPNCGTELDTDEKMRFLRGKAEIWRCPDCNRDYTRPAKTYNKEEENVERIVESVVRKAIGNGEQVLEGRKDFYTESWNGQSGLGPSRRRPY